VLDRVRTERDTGRCRRATCAAWATPTRSHRAPWFLKGIQAEGLGDNPAPALPADQQALISALEATGKPVIVVVIASRPLGLGSAESASAVLMAYQGSTGAGQAVADTVFGKIDPSGKLSVT
jgi:Glycosyl hydrolase family 3 C-terminal domain